MSTFANEYGMNLEEDLKLKREKNKGIRGLRFKTDEKMKLQ